jgi:hypothetical protein
VGNQPPDFPVEQGTEVEAEKRNCRPVGKHSQQVDNDVSDNQIPHQIRNSKAGVIVTEPIHGMIEFVQSETLPDLRMWNYHKAIIIEFTGRKQC